MNNRPTKPAEYTTATQEAGTDDASGKLPTSGDTVAVNTSNAATNNRAVPAVVAPPVASLDTSLHRFAEERAAKEAARCARGSTGTSIPGAVLERSQQRQKHVKEAGVGTNAKEIPSTESAPTASTAAIRTTHGLRRSAEERAAKDAARVRMGTTGSESAGQAKVLSQTKAENMDKQMNASRGNYQRRSSPAVSAPPVTLDTSLHRFAEERAAKEAARSARGSTGASLPGAILQRSQQRQKHVKEAGVAAHATENHSTAPALTTATANIRTMHGLRRSAEERAAKDAARVHMGACDPVEQTTMFSLAGAELVDRQLDPSRGDYQNDRSSGNGECTTTKPTDTAEVNATARDQANVSLVVPSSVGGTVTTTAATLNSSLHRFAEDRAAKEAARASVGSTCATPIEASIPGAVLQMSQHRRKEAKQAAHDMQNDSTKPVLATTIVPTSTMHGLRRSAEEPAAGETARVSTGGATLGLSTVVPSTTAQVPPQGSQRGLRRSMEDAKNAASVGAGTAVAANRTESSSITKLNPKGLHGNTGPAAMQPGAHHARASDTSFNPSASELSKSSSHGLSKNRKQVVSVQAAPMLTTVKGPQSFETKTISNTHIPVVSVQAPGMVTVKGPQSFETKTMSNTHIPVQCATAYVDQDQDHSQSATEYVDLEQEITIAAMGIAEIATHHHTDLSESNAMYDPVDPQIGNSRKRKKNDTPLVVGSIIFLLCLLVVIIVVAVVVKSGGNKEATKNQNEPFQSVTVAPSGLPNQPHSIIFQAFPNYTLEALKDPKSPQSLAHQWLLSDLEANNYTLTSRQKQRFALATLFYATNGNDWLNNDNWLSHSAHECFWFAQGAFLEIPRTEVELNRIYLETTHPNPCEMSPAQIDGPKSVHLEHGQYQHIWLHTNGLQGSLPLELYWLKNLRSISLYNNEDLTGTISSHIGKLRKLEAIDMGGRVQGATKIAGNLPTELGLLSHSMVSIAILNAQLEGSLPSELGLLHRMQYLLLGRNSLTGTLPTELGKASSLDWMYLGENSISGTIPVSLSKLPLEDLWLDSNLLTGTIHAEFGQISSLKRFDLRENHFSGTIPSALGQLSSLSYFNVWRSHLTGKIPSELAMISSLEVFQLSSNALTGMIPAEFEQLQLLYALSLEHNYLSGALPQRLTPALRILEVNNNTLLTGTLPSNLLNLHVFVLDGTQISGVLPDSLCDIDKLAFDCSSILCGCSCLCMNETNITGAIVLATNETNSTGSRM
ncbi:Leucine Rich Repeat [Seminavis robusta]|uniref:Leucine Rich Repeat n=1 Tax=Seminavis robusta TaxID=568900 RepID=A0A9N8HQW7_9STRA|nr:Leucine Rich Repeat [Seminavis robusta]|eukprot:Sro1245_g255740.1 Leucine Rich Repeat (1241) ;mRNA; r:25674-29396